MVCASAASARRIVAFALVLADQLQRGALVVGHLRQRPFVFGEQPRPLLALVGQSVLELGTHLGGPHRLSELRPP